MAKKKQRFELKAKGSGKFWEIELKGKSHTVRFGRIGTDGQTRTKNFESSAEAKTSCNKLIGQKTGKGYKAVTAKVKAKPSKKKVAKKKASKKKPSKKKASSKRPSRKKANLKTHGAKSVARKVVEKPFLKKIITRIEKLGGTFKPPKSNSLAANLAAIKFRHPLLTKNWDGEGLEKFNDKYPGLYEKNPAKFFDSVSQAFRKKSHVFRPQFDWRCQKFCPFDKDSEFNWSEDFDQDFYNLDPIREFAGEGPLEFREIIYSDGFPDMYFVCIQDSNPSDPTIFGTDHEEFFQEYSSVMPLSKFLDNLLTPEQFLKTAKKEAKYWIKS